MITIVIRSLPNGTVPFHQISDVSIRDAIMKLNENIKSVKSQLDTASSAVAELQRKVG